jgi:hypothetical protein
LGVLRGLMALGCPRLLVLGGGGYNPWSVGRLWTGVWATLNGIEIPDRLPKEGEEVLRALRWDRARAGRATRRNTGSPPCATRRAPAPCGPRSRTGSTCCGDGPRRAAEFPIF